MRWDAWITVLSGVWLLVAPFVIGYSTTSDVATAEAIVRGALITGLACGRLWARQRPPTSTTS
jgi:hypothetical protein